MNLAIRAGSGATVHATEVPNDLVTTEAIRRQMLDSLHEIMAEEEALGLYTCPHCGGAGAADDDDDDDEGADEAADSRPEGA